MLGQGLLRGFASSGEEMRAEPNTTIVERILFSRRTVSVFSSSS
jgi:hypothetical protein